MVDWLTPLPMWLGIIIAMIATSALGLLAYWISSKLNANRCDNSEREVAGAIFGAVALFVSLILPLAFTDAFQEMVNVENSVKAEVAALNDVLSALDSFETDSADDARASVLAYTRSVVGDDWEALEDDELSPVTTAAFGEAVTQVLAIEAHTPPQEERKTRMLDDLDSVSNARQERQNHALSRPTAYVSIVLAGLSITTALLGVHSPRPRLVAFVILYTAFIGAVLYVIVAIGDPFEGALGVGPDRFEALLDEWVPD